MLFRSDIEVPGFEVRADRPFALPALVHRHRGVVHHLEERHDALRLAVGALDVRTERAHRRPVVAQAAGVLGEERVFLDGVVDAAGVSASLQTALQLVRPDGWISKVGWGPQPLNFSLDPLVAKNVTLRGSFSHNWPMWERVLRLLGTGKLDLKPVLGGVFPIEKWQEAFEKMQSGQILKSVLTPK